MIEEASALNPVDKIAATPRVDVLFVVIGDLSFSLGLRDDRQQSSRRESGAPCLCRSGATKSPGGALEELVAPARN